MTEELLDAQAVATMLSGRALPSHGNASLWQSWILRRGVTGYGVSNLLNEAGIGHTYVPR